MGLQYDSYDSDNEGPVIFDRSTAKAKFNYRCTECRGIIEKGQHYEVVRGLWDRWETFRKCTHCMAFESAMEGHYRGFMHASPFGEMLAEGRQCFRDLFSVDHPGRYYSVAKKYVAIKKNYLDQAKRGVVDRLGRPNKILGFWPASCREQNDILRNTGKKLRHETRT
jgi:hypothetical protein